MQIKEISNKDEWENFLKKTYPKTFLQSWSWGDFSERMGQKIWRLGIYGEEDLISTALIVKVVAKRGTFLMIEHGPNSLKPDFKILELFLNKLKKLAKEEKASFIRICPIWENNDENRLIFKKLGFRNAPMFVHPEVSWILDIDKDEGEILKEMRKTTRYLIRRGLKDENIQIIKRKDIKSLGVFLEIFRDTVSRHNFVPFSDKYLKNEFISFIQNDEILILLGKYMGEVVAGAMIVYWQDMGFYHQGASIRKYSKMPVSYLLQWEAIREAKKRNCKYYSFWGIAPQDEVKHPWYGLSLFKKGFGGRREDYVLTQDYVLNYRYILNYLIEKIRRRRRRL